MHARLIRHWGVVGGLCGIAAGCTPCASGFSRGDEGICYADTPCPDGYARDEELRCAPVDEGSDTEADWTAADADPSDAEAGADTGLWENAVDSPPDGFGRIFIQYTGLDGLPMHGFFVMGHPKDEHQPSSAYCQVLLSNSVDVDGAMSVFDGVSQDCPLEGEVALYPNGEVQLFMQVAPGASADPVLCDERVVEVDGDTLVDFGDVIDCGR